MSGSWDSALAIITRRFMPPDRVMILLSRLPVRDKSLNNPVMKSGFGARPKSPRLKLTVAQTVSKESVVSSCGTRPILERAAR